MTMLKITSRQGTTEEEFSPAELAYWFTPAERAELERTGKLRHGRGLHARQIEVISSAKPDAADIGARIGGIYHLLTTEPNGQQNVTRYCEAEMAECFNPAQRRQLASGQVLTIARTSYVDMVLAARRTMAA